MATARRLAASSTRSGASGHTALDTRIHVVSDSAEALAGAARRGYAVYDIRPALAAAQNRFVGIDSNTIASDWLRFRMVYRWEAYRAVVHDLNSLHPAESVKWILILESDVLMTLNVPKFCRSVLAALKPSNTRNNVNSKATNDEQNVSGGYFDSVWIDSGAAMLFSPSGLLGFASFLDNWLLATTHEIVVDVAASQQSPLLDEFRLYRIYMEDAPASRSSCFEYGGNDPISNWNGVVDAVGCVPMKDMQDMRAVMYYNGSLLTETNPVSSVPYPAAPGSVIVATATDKLPYCYMVREIVLLA